MHTIAWVVMDDAGLTEGIGSRYFTVANGTALQATATVSAAQRAAREASTRQVRIGELELVELDVMDGPAPACGGFEAYERVGGARRPLPVGSTFDQATGRFSWQPGPGFVGTYHLVFSRPACEGSASDVLLNVTILSRPPADK